MKDCKHCGEEFDPTVPKQQYCSDSCRAKAFRQKQKEKQTMGGIDEPNNSVELYHHPTEEIDLKDATGTIFRQLKGQKDQALKTAHSYQTRFETERELRLSAERAKERLEDKIERIQLEHKHELERTKEKFERELKDHEASNGMGSIIREMATPEVIREVGPPLIQALGGLFNRGQQMGSLPAYSPLAKKIADLVESGAPEEQQKLFNLISSVINEAQLQKLGDNGVIILIDSIINSLNNGTFRNKQQAAQ